MAPRVACEGSEHLSRAVGEIIEGAGEGSILRLMGSRYIPGRSDSLIKFKVLFSSSTFLPFPSFCFFEQS